MLEARPAGTFSRDYVVTAPDGHVVATIDPAWFRERAEVVMDGSTYACRSRGIFRPEFTLAVADRTIAIVRRRGAFSRRLEVEVAWRRFELRPRSIWSRAFELVGDDGKPCGAIARRGFFRRDAVIDLPEELPSAVQVFLFWVVLVIWRRAAAAAASGGS